MNKPEFYQQIEYNKQFINKGSKTLQKAKSVKNSLRTQAKKSSDPKVKHTNYIRQSELIISWKNPKKNRINSNKLYTKNNVLETIFFSNFQNPYATVHLVLLRRGLTSRKTQLTISS